MTFTIDVLRFAPGFGGRRLVEGADRMKQIRATRTEEYLVEALVELLGEKSIYKVQVRELCQRAQVNRTTFYKHYENMEIFIERIVDSFLRAMDENLGGENVFVGLLSSSAPETYRRCVSFMTDNLSFVQAMVGPNGTPLLRERIMAHWSSMFAQAIATCGLPSDPKVEPDILGAYVVSVMWAMLEYTIQAGEKYTPGYMASQFSFLLHDCTLKTLVELSS